MERSKQVKKAWRWLGRGDSLKAFARRMATEAERAVVSGTPALCADWLKAKGAALSQVEG